MGLRDLMEGTIVASLVHDITKQLTADIRDELAKLEERITKLEAAEGISAAKNHDTNSNESHKKDKAATKKSGRRRKEPKQCSVEGCERDARCKGLCLYHYQKSRIKAQAAQSDDAQKIDDEAKAKQERLEQVKPIIRKNDVADTSNNESNHNITDLDNNVPNSDDTFTHPGLRPIV